MTDPEWKEWACEYPFDRSKWCLTVMARTKEEAEARLKAIGGWGTVEGELFATIPAGVPGASLYVRVRVWLGNLLRKLRHA